MLPSLYILQLRSGVVCDSNLALVPIGAGVEPPQEIAMQRRVVVHLVTLRSFQFRPVIPIGKVSSCIRDLKSPALERQMSRS